LPPQPQPYGTGLAHGTFLNAATARYPAVVLGAETASLLGIFSFVALALAAIGIYGVLSYSVAQRSREIGVRMAVGATRANILRLVLSQAAQFTAVGLAFGLAAALAGARLIRGLLFDTAATDPLSVAIAIGFLACAAAMAAIIPATRAASVNPTHALRSE